MGDFTLLAKFMKYSGIFLIFIIIITIANIQFDYLETLDGIREPTFIETCDKWDGSKWVYEGNPPTVLNGTWIFQFPVGTAKLIHARSVALFGYGYYKITFRTSGPRQPGVNYYIFLYLDQTASGGPFNELDIPELWGDMGPYQMSISTYKATEANNAYRFWQSSINFEDGATHTWGFNYTEKRLEFYIGDQLSFVWDDDPVTPKFANPPMDLIIGGRGLGTNTVPWTWYVSQIEYQAPS
jgi:hypothetical protein